MELSYLGEWEWQLTEEESQEDELDLPPEYCYYRDEGCELSDSCLNCALPQCVHDEPGGRQRWLKRFRNEEIIRMFRSEGREIKELAKLFDISRRTVQRVLKESLTGLKAPGGER